MIAEWILLKETSGIEYEKKIYRKLYQWEKYQITVKDDALIVGGKADGMVLSDVTNYL